MREEHLKRTALEIPVRTDLSAVYVDQLLASTCLDPASPHAAGIREALRRSPELAGALVVLVEDGWTMPALAPSTKRTDSKAFATFDRWCQAKGVPSLPASTLTVHRFLAEKSRTVKAKTVRMYVKAISRHHHDQQLTDPTRHPLIETLVEAVERQAEAKADRDSVYLEDLHLLVDTVDAGGYWSKLRNPTVRELLRLRWRALILIEWVASLSARDSLQARVDDLEWEPSLGLRLAPTVERPEGIRVEILRYSNPAYDAAQASAEWLEAVAPFLPDCRHMFPAVLYRATPVVICGVCTRIETVDPSPERIPGADVVEEAVAEAVRTDSSKFDQIVTRAGLGDGDRAVTREGLRLGASSELARYGVSAERRRRQKRTTRVVTDVESRDSLSRLAQIATDLTRS